MPASDVTEVTPARSVGGELRVPGDKSISHRYALLSALADGTSTIDNYAPGADCASTLACLAGLGVGVVRTPAASTGNPPVVHITGCGLRGLAAPLAPLDCGNSGSTMRMIAGVLAAHPFTSILFGDLSLSRRPMRRVVTPLTAMGASIEVDANGRPPMTIHGRGLHGIDYAPDTPSAQVKSAVLLAGLQAAGTTTVIEPAGTRDHTELALAAFGATVAIDGRRVALRGGQRLAGRQLRVPGDVSSAAFPAVAAAALPGSEVTISGVGLNPSRTRLLDVLRRAGAEVVATIDDHWDGEPVGRIVVRHRGLRDFVIEPAEVPEIIDELPVLGALATFGGSIRVSGAGELRVKESDRIASLVGGFRAMGADADERPDGFVIRGGRRLTGGEVDAHGDHRLAMAFAVAALGAAGPTRIAGAEVVAVSYPSFFADLDRLRV
jgi:3-phosphoshikimate 1-carboxyvinyltransferase